MAETKLPITTTQGAGELARWRPFENLRREVDRLFEDFDRSSWLSPLRRPFFEIEPSSWGAAPAIDFVETENAFEVTAELPGLDEKNIEVKLGDGNLMIKGEKQEETEEREKDYYVHERRFGAFERLLRVPESVDREKIEASFKQGVLTVTLPKKPEACKPEKKIEVKAA